MRSFPDPSPYRWGGKLVLLSALLSSGACTQSDSVGRLGSGGHGGSAASTVGGSGGAGGGAGGVTTSVAGSGGLSATGGARATGGMTGGGGTTLGTGGGGQAGADAATTPDAPLSSDAGTLAELCKSTGGQPTASSCCTSSGEYPNTCSAGACACAPASSHTVVSCACPSGGCFSPAQGCIPRPGGSGGSAGAGGTGGTSVMTGGAPGSGGAGSGGSTGSDGGGDAPLGTDATVLVGLCTTTGGQVSTSQCCNGTGDFPSSCTTGPCGCAPSSSHAVATCICPTGSCFSPTTGCGPRTTDAGDDLASESDGDGCTARPELDSVQCGGSRPAHYYTCIMTMLPEPCTTLSIGGLTNTFCCP